MPKMGNTFVTIQELEKKKEYLLGLSSVIPTWNTSYQFLFKEIQQELLGGCSHVQEISGLLEQQL